MDVMDLAPRLLGSITMDDLILPNMAISTMDPSTVTVPRSTTDTDQGAVTVPNTIMVDPSHPVATTTT
jgi:hypothetical protein